MSLSAWLMLGSLLYSLQLSTGSFPRPLTEEEERIYKRGRNANPHSHPRGATRREYQIATGLEALFGWLYIQGNTPRLNELFEIMMEEET